MLRYLFSLSIASLLTLILGAASAQALSLTPQQLIEIPASAEQGANNNIHKVHGFHCRGRYGWRHGRKRWHKHWRACRQRYYRDDYYYYYAPRYYYYPRPRVRRYYYDHRPRRHYNKRRHHNRNHHFRLNRGKWWDHNLR